MPTRDEFKDLEQQLMVLRDRYAEIARALGFEGDAFWGDVHDSHAQILEAARNARWT